MLTTAAAYLPLDWQEGLKRLRFRRQVKAGRFIPDEPEMTVISNTVGDGDTVIDVGANVGHYTLHLSQCAGPNGRVIAFEPIPQTFELLSSNVRASQALNVTLVNMAASSEAATVSMDLPKLRSGLDNYYQAAIGSSGRFRVMCVPIDSFNLPKVRLIKIDAEGHDWEVLKGAEKTIRRDHPVLIIEAGINDPVCEWLVERGYVMSHIKGSPNIVAT